MTRLNAWAPPVAWAALILLLGHMPPPVTPRILFPHVDKIVHFVEYLVLGLLLVRATHISQWKGPTARALIIGLLFALADEFHQAWFPGRVSDIFDFVADGLGLIGASMAHTRLAARAGGQRTRDFDP